MSEQPQECPDPYALADEQDDAGWNVGKHGRMRDFATPDDAVETVAWRPED